MCIVVSSSDLFIFTIVLQLSIFCKCSLFIRRKKDAMECPECWHLGNVPM